MKSINLFFLFALLTGVAVASESEDPTQKLRDQLRGVMLQLRTAQTDAANGQAAAAAAEQKNKDLANKFADLEKRNASFVKQSSVDKAVSDEAIGTLNGKLADREKRIVKYAEALEKWKDGYQKASGVARTKEEERSKLAAEIVVHQRTIADRETKNISLFNTATEVLNRFENYSLGKALAAREPFISKTRVKVENLVQGYKDRILDNRISAPAKQP